MLHLLIAPTMHHLLEEKCTTMSSISLAWWRAAALGLFVLLHGGNCFGLSVATKRITQKLLHVWMWQTNQRYVSVSVKTEEKQWNKPCRSILDAYMLIDVPVSVWYIRNLDCVHTNATRLRSKYIKYRVQKLCCWGFFTVHNTTCTTS
jgi:hypothetical protein